ncbi:MAG: DUF1064 domain-containing protein, partial [Methylobacteriaceae bacterium]|nr:DUF1064 domain-containing protein [Methylobacteriaceae bacterium]
MTKYRAQKTTCLHSHLHDSKLEARRCDELHVLEENGELTHLELQPIFPVQIN